MASRKRTPAKAGKRAVAPGKTKPNGKSLNGKHAKHVNGKTNGTASVLAVQVPKARKDQLKSKTPPAKRGDTVKSQIVLPVGYRPTDDEPFMNERQRIYFRKKLLTWREEIILQTRETLQGLHEDSSQHADIADRATFETDRALELRARDRQRKLISKIDSAIARIDDGSYGYCEETGEPISLKRLDARPIATLSLEAQERHERRERVFRED
jgi:DnaK suppressor protein